MRCLRCDLEWLDVMKKDEGSPECCHGSDKEAEGRCVASLGAVSERSSRSKQRSRYMSDASRVSLTIDGQAVSARGPDGAGGGEAAGIISPALCHHPR